MACVSRQECLILLSFRVLASIRLYLLPFNVARHQSGHDWKVPHSVKLFWSFPLLDQWGIVVNQTELWLRIHTSEHAITSHPKLIHRLTHFFTLRSRKSRKIILIYESVNPFVIVLIFYMLSPYFKRVLRSAAAKYTIKNILVPASSAAVDLALHCFALVLQKAFKNFLACGRFHVVFQIQEVLFKTILHVQLFLMCCKGLPWVLFAEPIRINFLDLKGYFDFSIHVFRVNVANFLIFLFFQPIGIKWHSWSFHEGLFHFSLLCLSVPGYLFINSILSLLVASLGFSWPYLIFSLLNRKVLLLFKCDKTTQMDYDGDHSHYGWGVLRLRNSWAALFTRIALL